MSNQVARSDVSYYSPTTFVLQSTMAGPWAPVPVSITAKLYQGGLVTLTFPVVLATQTLSSPAIVVTDALPAVFRPSAFLSLPARLINNTNPAPGWVSVAPGGGLTFTLDAGNFSGTCGMSSPCVTYQV